MIMLPPHNPASTKCKIPSKVPKVSKADFVELSSASQVPQVDTVKTANESSQPDNESNSKAEDDPLAEDTLTCSIEHSCTMESIIESTSNQDQMYSSLDTTITNVTASSMDGFGAFFTYEPPTISSHQMNSPQHMQNNSQLNYSGEVPVVHSQSYSTMSMLEEDEPGPAQDESNVQGLDTFLAQFDAFFRRKLDEELHQFREGLHALITEQEVHLRKIVSVGTEDMTQGPIGHACGEVTTDYLHERSVLSPSECIPPCDDVVTSASLAPQHHQAHQQAASVPASPAAPQEVKAKAELVMELLSLSCQLTTVLNRPKYRLAVSSTVIV